MKISRKDIGYTIYSRLEEALRNWIGACLGTMSERWLDNVPNGIVDKVLDQSSFNSADDIIDPIDLLDETNIPDLVGIICYKKSFAKYVVNGELTQEQFQRHLEDLYCLRNKIAHVKQTFTALDLDRLLEIAEVLLSILGDHGDEVNETVECINKNPESVVIRIPSDFFLDEKPLDSCPNNLPTSDYDPDGGFIGRKDDIKKLRSLVLGDLDRVITISGAGGVGKTALAHKFCKALLEKSPTPFDSIVWISAKEERLTLTGIEPIQPMIRNYDELIDNILEVYGFDISAPITQRKENIELILKATNKGILLDLQFKSF